MVNFLFLNIFEGGHVCLRVSSFFVLFVLIFVFITFISREVYGYVHYASEKRFCKQTSDVSNGTGNKDGYHKERVGVRSLIGTYSPRYCTSSKHGFNNRELFIELFVEMQRKNIGMRNVRHLKIGNKMYVGGGKNDEFLIFLVHLPSKLASIEYDGEAYIFKILKPSFFPYEKEREVKACIGRVFVIVSEKGYHIYVTFLPHEVLCKSKSFHIKHRVC